MGNGSVSPVYLVPGLALMLAWAANGIVLRVRNWHRPFALAAALVGLTAGAAYLVLPQVTRASQSLLMPVIWISLSSLVIKLLVLGRMRGLRLGAPSALLAWLLELGVLVGLALAVMMGALVR